MRAKTAHIANITQASIQFQDSETPGKKLLCADIPSWGDVE